MLSTFPLPAPRANTNSLFALIGIVAWLVLWPTASSADCALIPTALQPLPSTLGSVDRPFAAPGDTIRIFSLGACDPTADQFDLNPANNVVTLSFPASGAADFPANPTATPLTASTVADCGVDRCYAMTFVVPDTTDHDVMSGTGEPLAGPIRIQVTNTVTGTVVADIDPLFEPTPACNPENRFRNLFQNFTLLPPRNSFATGLGTFRTTTDGSGALLVPLEYLQVLTSLTGGTANLRLLTVDANVPNGLATPLPGVPAGDNALIRLPRDGEFVRSFSFEGRPIPPLLEVTASTPALEASNYGDRILGSVDFIDSVIRIAKSGPDPDNPGNTVQVFALNGEQVTAAGLLDPVNGAGPIIVSGLSLGQGPAAPLNSLNASGEAAAVARDESLEGDLNDGDTDDLVVGVIDLDTGSDFNTGLSVLEVAQSPRKAAIVTNGPLVGFLQSESNDATDANGDGDMTDGIPWIYDVDGNVYGLGVETGDPSANFDGDGPLALDGNWLFYLQNEADESQAGTVLESVAPSSASAPSNEPALSGDASVVAWSEAPATSSAAVTLDLADIVGGGNGLGTGTANQAIDISTGFPTSLFASGVVTPVNSYIPSSNPFVDGVFVPDGGPGQTASIPVSSTGLFVTGVSDSTLFGSATTWDHIRNGINTSTSTALPGSLIGVHTSKGITFDLGAIEAANPGLQATQVDLTAAMGANANGNADYYVYLDGVLVAQTNITATADGTVTFPSIPVAPTNRFLTLMTVANGPINFDWAMWQNPTVTLDGNNLLNGSFESPLLAGPSRVSIDNLILWNASGGFSLLEQGVNGVSGIAAQDGLQFVSMGHSGFNDTVLSQTVATQAGSDYQLQYWVRAIQGTTAPTQVLEASAWNALGAVIASTSHAVDDFSQWTQYSLNFTATGASTMIRFQDTGGASPENIALDNVTLVQTSNLPGPLPKQIFAVETSIVENLSAPPGGSTGDDDSGLPTLSGDGRHAAYLSRATNLVPGNPGEGEQVYWIDRNTGVITRVTEALGGGASDASAGPPEFSLDGSTIVYGSFASDLVAGVTGGAFEIYAYDTATGTNSLVSVDDFLQPLDVDSGGFVGVNADGTLVAFATPAAPTLSEPDTNGFMDVYVRDSATFLIERVSRGLAGAEPNGPSDRPHMSDDGNRVVFRSQATNLSDESTQPGQCYVYDRAKKTTLLVSRTVGGAPVSTGCENPRISGDGRFAVYHSDAPELSAGLPSGIARTYRFDILTGVVEEVSVDDLGTPADAPSLFERPAISTDGRTVTFASSAGNLTSVDGASEDVFSRSLVMPTDLTGDGDGNDRLLRALEAALPPRVPLGPAVPIGDVSVAGDRALFVQADNGLAQLYQPSTGDLVPLTPNASAPALSNEAACLLIGPSVVAFQTPANLLAGQPLAASNAPGTSDLKAVDSLSGNPAEAKCVYIDVAGFLIAQRMDGSAPTQIAVAEDFQVDPQGIAFRTCEADVAMDLNGDNDEEDCEMRFWNFEAEEDGDPTTDPLVLTQRTAVPCELPGCDPFFEPYRIRGNVLSFVSREEVETETDGGSGRGISCLPTSPTPGCDLTGDNDSDDLAVQIVNVLSQSLAAQVFPLSEENPPETAPFPEVSENGDGLLVLELPAGIVPGFESLPPEQRVTVIAADSDGDGTFDTDGLLNPAVQVVDNCAELPNANQTDADGDGLGAACDTTLTGGAANDDPQQSPAPADIPGSTVCDLNGSGTIIQPEVDQIWLDWRVPIAAPALVNGQLVPRDNRDPDADGVVTAVDYSICQAQCNAQPGGCQASEPVGGGSACGLGFEIAPLLILLARVRRRNR